MEWLIVILSFLTSTATIGCSNFTDSKLHKVAWKVENLHFDCPHSVLFSAYIRLIRINIFIFPSIKLLFNFICWIVNQFTLFDLALAFSIWLHSLFHVCTTQVSTTLNFYLYLTIKNILLFEKGAVWLNNLWFKDIIYIYNYKLFTIQKANKIKETCNFVNKYI